MPGPFSPLVQQAAPTTPPETEELPPSKRRQGPLRPRPEDDIEWQWYKELAKEHRNATRTMNERTAWFVVAEVLLLFAYGMSYTIKNGSRFVGGHADLILGTFPVVGMLLALTVMIANCSGQVAEAQIGSMFAKLHNDFPVKLMHGLATNSALYDPNTVQCCGYQGCNNLKSCRCWCRNLLDWGVPVVFIVTWIVMFQSVDDIGSLVETAASGAPPGPDLRNINIPVPINASDILRDIAQNNIGA